MRFVLKSQGLLLCFCLIANTFGQTQNRNAGVKSVAQSGEKRLALVIGSEAYKSIPPLTTPVNGAADMANALNIDAYTHRGLIYSNLDRYNLAIAEFSKALNLSPDNKTALHNHAVSHSSNEQYDLALIDFDKVTSLDPSSAYIYYFRRFACMGKTNKSTKKADRLKYENLAAADDAEFKELEALR